MSIKERPLILELKSLGTYNNVSPSKGTTADKVLRVSGIHRCMLAILSSSCSSGISAFTMFLLKEAHTTASSSEKLERMVSGFSLRFWVWSKCFSAPWKAGSFVFNKSFRCSFFTVLYDDCRNCSILFTTFFLCDQYDADGNVDLRVDLFLCSGVFNFFLFSGDQKHTTALWIIRVSVAVTYLVIWTTAFVANYSRVRYILRISQKNS